MTGDIESRVRDILVEVFDLNPDTVGPRTSPDTVEAWDSLQHLTVVLSLEEEFNVGFTDEETVTMTNFELIVLTLREKLA